MRAPETKVWRSHSESPETWFGSLVPALCSVTFGEGAWALSCHGL